jgi:hypothetical protein
MLDRLPSWARDLIVSLAATLLAWLASDVAPVLQGQPGVWALVGALLVLLANAVSPWLTREYGAGRPRTGRGAPGEPPPA